METTIRKRHDILEELVDSSQSKPDLVSQMDLSRSTIDRGVNELLEHDCITRTGSTYEATETGRLAIREYERYLRFVETIKASPKILNEVPTNTFDTVFLRDADFDLVDDQQPWAVLEKSTELMKNAKSLKGTVPVIFQRHFADLTDSFDTGKEVELIWDNSLYHSLSEEMQEMIATFQEYDQATMYRTDLTDSYAIWILDSPEGNHASIAVFTNGGIRGIIRNDTCAAVDWALSQYEQRKESAVSITSRHTHNCN
ncbi:hypothetical protein C499_06015 [Halogeometricum borinquense DSM 11551]|nr:winged helix-turn-helix domain-containing protein [Halogeometricum borinquense]ELY29390.1 hypothetical protein C499_06015 [Halogeometricum borinquense DSM 11551]